MSEFYTWVILLINQLGDFGEKQLSVFDSSGGPNLPLNASTRLQYLMIQTRISCQELCILFVFDALYPSQQFFSHVGTISCLQEMAYI